MFARHWKLLSGAHTITHKGGLFEPNGPPWIHHCTVYTWLLILMEIFEDVHVYICIIGWVTSSYLRNIVSCNLYSFLISSSREPASHVIIMSCMMTLATLPMIYKTSLSNCVTCFHVVTAVSPILLLLIVLTLLLSELAICFRTGRIKGKRDNDC